MPENRITPKTGAKAYGVLSKPLAKIGASTTLRTLLHAEVINRSRVDIGKGKQGEQGSNRTHDEVRMTDTQCYNACRLEPLT